jgi:putative ABC transport system permease protein
MSHWSRLVNAFRGDRLNRDIDAELEAHIADAIADGCDPAEARRAMGPLLRHRAASRDARLLPWLESLVADLVFGLRSLQRTPVTSAAAILSLALAIGACTAAFRLVDALLLRPLPIEDPDRLFVVVRSGVGWWDGKARESDSFTYPLFRQMRAAARDRAELIAVSYASRTDLTYGADADMEKAQRQYVSGHLFDALGVGAAHGRVLAAGDDVTPGAHPYAVIAHGYWLRRFNGDPDVLGRTFRIGATTYTIVGVAQRGFTGTQPGTFVDVFLPTMMNARSVEAVNAFWIRVLVRPARSSSLVPITERIEAVFRTMERDRARGFTNFPEHLRAGYPQERLVVRHAAAGVSDMQETYRLALTALSGLVALVLLIACANVGNLMTVRTAARSRELALRVSIGAGRTRLVQLLLIESAWMATLATLGGWLLAWWSAPLVVALINPADRPAQLDLPLDTRILAFGIALACTTTALFGFVPAWRASRVSPAKVFKGGADPRARSRLMYGLIAAQVGFCLVVLIVAGLLIATYQRLSQLPTGYSSARLLAVETTVSQPQPPAHWDQVASHLRALPGVETVGFSEWPLMSGEMTNDFVSIANAPPSDALTYFLPVSPGWLETMTIPLLQGRDLRPEDERPGAALVNQTFVRQYFGDANPLDRTFDTPQPGGAPSRRYRIVGVVGDARYNELRRPIVPVAYVPYRSVDDRGMLQLRSRAAFMVRTTGTDPTALAAAVRAAVPAARAEFRVTTIRTQGEIDDAHTVRERLLATVALFFAVTALVLACVGLYGVLDHSVLQQRRDIGIRVAIGAQPANVVRHVVGLALLTVMGGMVAGLAAAVVSARFIEALLYEATATQPRMLVLPLCTLLAVAVLAALPATIRAVRIAPAALLRSG